MIGSGPAGCSAASTCAKAGLDVLIVTQEAEQSEFAVSAAEPLESIHPGVSSLLEKIGAAGAELLASRARYSGIQAGNTYTSLGEDENGVWQGFHINRKVFNEGLLRHMRNQGITVRMDDPVESFILDQERSIGIKTASTDLHARYIIDASGKKAIAGKKFNFKRKFFSPPLLCWTGVSGGMDAYPFDAQAAHFIPGLDGWTWLAPRPPGQCAWTRLRVRGEKSLLPPDQLKEYTTLGKIHFANMRWRIYRPVCREGIVLCGDAAGVLDPAAGQGIFNALWSGITAANTVVSCLRQPDLESFHLAYYDDWFVQQFESKVKQLTAYYEEHDIKIFT